MAERPVRDRLGEALRRRRFGLVRPLWADQSADGRELWCGEADDFLRLASECGLEIKEADHAPPPSPAREGASG